MAVATALVAVAFLLSAGAAQAYTLVFSGENATKILNLQVGSTFYDISFRHESAQDIYGTVPVFDFTTSLAAEAAMDAVNAALDSEAGVMSAGPAYNIVYEIPFEFLGDIAGVDFVSSREALYVDIPNVSLGTPAWLQRSDSQARPFAVSKTYADFAFVPELDTGLLVGLGLAGLAFAGRPRRRENHGRNTWRVWLTRAGGPN